jgi:hypothetical protein
MKMHPLFTAIIALALVSLVPFRVKGETDPMKKSAHEAWTRLLEEGYRNNAIYAWVENDPALPNVLLYGDSISIGYTQRVRAILKNHPDILVNDLFGFTQPKQPEWWAKPGDVHYNPVGQQAQGDEVARVILKALESRKQE